MNLCDVAGLAPARGAGSSMPSALAIEAAARDALKAYLRIDDDAEDALLDRLIAAAIGHGEAFTGRLFLIRQVEETIRPMPEWRRLAWGPVRAIATPQVLAADGGATAVASGGHAIDIDAAGDGWVRAAMAMPGWGGGRWRITYSAGISADWAGLPDPLRHAAIRLAAHLHAHRDDEAEAPAAVAALWRPWRRIRLA